MVAMRLRFKCNGNSNDIPKQTYTRGVVIVRIQNPTVSCAMLTQVVGVISKTALREMVESSLESAQL